ncbi:unnamed protein product [Lactuca saligna]|uniref:K-box domain-containing protein n=1 Tax=Lactuca saligna TaxID=75948 RepID=A0AA35YRA4_LACSI|nr:unnamed protein product [Lactuca saligna]
MKRHSNRRGTPPSRAKSTTPTNEYEAENRSTKGDSQDSELPLKCKKFRTCKQLLQMVDRLVEENNNDDNHKELSVVEMTNLEEELNAALMQTRSRKTQLMMEHVSTLQQQEKDLINEKEEIVQQNASAENVFGTGGGGLNNDLSVNQMDSPQHLTLPLFIT